MPELTTPKQGGTWAIKGRRSLANFKKLPLRLSHIIYLGLILVSLAIIIKPGASTFHYRLRIDPTQVMPDAGYAYRYPVKVNTFFFPPTGGVLLENNQQLSKDSSTLLTEVGEGRYFLTDPHKEAYYLYFAPQDNSDPRTNGNTYTLYLPVVFFSRAMGLFYLVIASFLLINPITDLRNLDPYRSAIWRRLFGWVILAAYIYVGLEWLFFITKPSFMDTLGAFQKIELLLQTGFLLAFPALLISLILWGLSHLPGIKAGQGILLALAAVLPAAIFAGLSMLLLDNFTYTLFKIGIVTTQGIWRLVYGGGFLLVVVLFHRRILISLGVWKASSKSISVPRIGEYVLPGLFALSLALVIIRLDFAALTNAQAIAVRADGQPYPNIILLGGDGLDAAHLSAYGYERNTTPTLKQLAAGALVAENAFPNAAHSSGSVISILTGKLPTQTRVLYPPDILQEKDAYQHLPGILKREGYYTAELGVVHYVDAYTMNMQEGFNMVNNRSAGETSLFQFLPGAAIDKTIYFASLLMERISERLKHIFYIQEMENPITKVLTPSDYLEDEERIEKLKEIINTTETPFFVHVHMMGTHGPDFYPSIQQYSLGKTQAEKWMADFYDDAILSFDAYLGSVVDALEQSGKINNTILIVYSDHGMKYVVHERIPLIFSFPNGEHAGRIQANVQNLDIAPTLLDYLGLPIPDWMGGESLLSANLPPDRLIFATGTSSAKIMSDGNLVVEKVTPPFYQFSYFSVVQCDQWFQVNIDSGHWMAEEVEGHTAPCKAEDMLSIEEIKQELAEHLAKNQFDVSTLP
jgi:hypothetical protein